MKTLRTLLQPMKALRKPKAPDAGGDLADVLRACEAAAVGMKSTSDELAACWSALRGALAAGANRAELLRTRAWCNVLELRLKEQAHALEDARHGVDAVWREMIRKAREDRPALNASAGNSDSTSGFDTNWPLLVAWSSRVRDKARRENPSNG